MKLAHFLVISSVNHPPKYITGPQCSILLFCYLANLIHIVYFSPSPLLVFLFCFLVVVVVVVLFYLVIYFHFLLFFVVSRS